MRIQKSLFGPSNIESGRLVGVVPPSVPIANASDLLVDGNSLTLAFTDPSGQLLDLELLTLPSPVAFGLSGDTKSSNLSVRTLATGQQDGH